MRPCLSEGVISEREGINIIFYIVRLSLDGISQVSQENDKAQKLSVRESLHFPRDPSQVFTFSLITSNNIEHFLSYSAQKVLGPQVTKKEKNWVVVVF